MFSQTSDPFDRHQNPFDNESVDQHQNPFDNDSTSSSSSGDTEPPGPSCSQSEGVNTENNTSTYSFSSMDLLVYQRIQQILRDPTILLRTNNSELDILNFIFHFSCEQFYRSYNWCSVKIQYRNIANISIKNVYKINQICINVQNN